MKNFWRKLIINLIIRLLMPLLVWLAAKGVLTNEPSADTVLLIATMIFNAAQTGYNQFIARWNNDLARQVDPSTTRGALARLSATVGAFTKIIEAATPGPNPTAMKAAQDVTPKH